MRRDSDPGPELFLLSLSNNSELKKNSNSNNNGAAQPTTRPRMDQGETLQNKLYKSYRYPEFAVEFM